MKYLAVIFLCTILVHFSTQVPKYENCDRQVLPASRTRDCVKVTCLNKNDYKVEECEKFTCPPGAEQRNNAGPSYEEFPKCCGNVVCIETKLG